METKTMYSILALGVIALLGISFTFAYQGNPSLNGPNYSPERHEAMEEAIESGNYADWFDLMNQVDHPGMARILEVVTEENFDLFVQMHEAMEDGNIEVANEIRAELGLGQGRMNHGNGQGLRDGTHSGQGQMKGRGMGSNQGYYENCPYAN